MPSVYWSDEKGSYSSAFYSRVQGYKQKPFDPKHRPPMAYYRHQLSMNDADLGPFGTPCGTSFWGEIFPDQICLSGFDDRTLSFTSLGQQAYNRAYQKFKDKAYTQAANLTAIAEISKTRSMINKRMQQLLKGATQLRNGRFREFLRTFGVKALKKHQHKLWSRPNEASGLWLEYWMGWAPTIGDISNSIETLTKDVPPQKIRAGSSVPLDNSNKMVSGDAIATTNIVGRGSVWINGLVEVTNPNLHLAQKLGLINVAKTVWETVRMSFLVDWFTNVGQVLGQFTDWVGLQLTGLVVSVKSQATSSWSLKGARSIFGWNYPSTMKHSKEFLWFNRYVLGGLPLVKPTLSLPDKLSLSRAATAASLLVTIFAPKKAIN